MLSFSFLQICRSFIDLEILTDKLSSPIISKLMCKLKVFLGFCFFFVQSFCLSSCYPMKESLLLFNRQENITTFNFYSVGREGTVGLGFSPSKTVTKESLILLFTSPNSFLELQNHVEKKQKNEFIYDIKIENTFNTMVDNYNSIEFKINNTNLKNKNHIFLSRYRGSGNLTTSKHQYASIYDYSIINETTGRYHFCTPESIKSYRLLISFLPIGIPRFIFTLLIFFLLVYFRTGQPLKSRNSGPFYICLSQLMEFMIILIRDSMGVSFDINYRCIVDSLVSYPTLYMLTAIVMSFYSRYLIINNLNQQKKVYANGKLPFFYVLLGNN